MRIDGHLTPLDTPKNLLFDVFKGETQRFLQDEVRR